MWTKLCPSGEARLFACWLCHINRHHSLVRNWVELHSPVLRPSCGIPIPCHAAYGLQEEGQLRSQLWKLVMLYELESTLRCGDQMKPLKQTQASSSSC